MCKARVHYTLLINQSMHKNASNYSECDTVVRLLTEFETRNI